MLILSERDMRACFSMADAIDAADEAFRAVSKQVAVVPLRTVAELSDVSGQLISMPGYVPAQKEAAENGKTDTDAALGVKVLGFLKATVREGCPLFRQPCWC